jgi:hypothetical protein
MALVHITDHQIRAARRLIRQYRNATNLPALISALTAEDQVLEDVVWGMFVETIESATAAQLDVYGRIVNQPREGRDEATYRLWIRTRVQINRSSGTIPQLVDILTALVAGTTYVHLEEQFPAGQEIGMGFTAALDPPTAYQIVQKCKAGGVRTLLEIENVAPSGTFTLDVGPGLDVGHLADYVTEDWAPYAAPTGGTLSWVEHSLGIAAQAIASNPDGSVLLAVGPGVQRSTDGGASWDTVTAPGTLYFGVAWMGSGFVLVGPTGQCATSNTGGTVLTSRTMPDSGTYQAVAVNGSTIVAVTAEGTSAVSTNAGATWAGPYTIDLSKSAYAIVPFGAGFVCVGGGALGAVTTDGASWTLHDLVSGGDIQDFQALATDDTKLVATGYAYAPGLMAGSVVSTDGGLTWSTVHSMPAAEVYGLTFAGTTLVSVGYDGVSGGTSSDSLDGTSWTAQPAISAPCFGACYAAGHVIAAGTDIIAIGTLS